MDSISITCEMMPHRYDLHIHSNFSDGQASINEITERANMLHLETIAITDHFWPSLGSQFGGKNLIENRRKQIEKRRMDFPEMLILDGVEVDIQSNGELAPVDGGLSQFDLVIGSFHWVTDSTRWVSALQKALRMNSFHILGHWDGYLSSYREEDGERAVELLAEAGVTIELNARYMTENPDFLESAKKAGCKFTLGSDSHIKETIGQLEFQRKLAVDYELEMLNPHDLTRISGIHRNAT
ncbi:PHP domain-containing protein [Candidatus Thorarchaeota archaeon]|nr:MAG: PHP domain-containing protein [Candidatus Thorarchaeota archaeon]